MWILAFLACVSGFACVALGAFSAHGLSDPQAKAWFDAAARWQGLHTLAVFAAIGLQRWGARRALWAAAAFLVGVVLFSGSLYALGLGAPRWLGMVTPVGGVCFLVGWAILAWATLGGKNAAAA